MERANIDTLLTVTTAQIMESHPGLISTGPEFDLSHLGFPFVVEVPKPEGNYQRGPNELVNGEVRMTWVEAEPTPPSPKQYSSLAFLDLFTEVEQLTIASAAMQSAQLKLWYDKTLAALFITIDDPRTKAGLDALVANGLISSERRDTIVAEMSDV
jgi:hypothetical protein